MPEPAYSILYSATLDAAEETLAIGDVVVLNEDGDAYLVATDDNRSSAGRPPNGIARSAASTENPRFELQQFGIVPASVSGLGAGTAVAIICSAAGRLERKASPDADDDVMGRCDEDGTAYIGGRVLVLPGAFPSGTGVVTVTNDVVDGDAVAPGASGVPLVSNGTQWVSGSASLTAGVTGTLPIANGGTGVSSIGGAFVGTTATQTLTNKTINASSNTVTNVSLTTGVTGTLPVANGGTGTTTLTFPGGTDVLVARTSTDTLVNKTISGTDNTISNVALATAVTGTLAQTKGGMGADISGVSGLLKNTAGTISGVTAPSGTVVGTSDSQTLTNKTISGASNTLTVRLANDVSGTLPVANGGTGITSFGTGVATWLGTPSGANLASALTTAVPNTVGGTGQDSSAWSGLAKVASGTWSAITLDANVATWLGTPSSENLAAAVTDETGTGSLCFATGPSIATPAISNPTMTGTIQHLSLPQLTIKRSVATVNTTSALATTLTTYTVGVNRTVHVEAMVTNINSLFTSAAAYLRRAVYLRAGAGPALVGSVQTVGTDIETTAGDDVTFDISSNDVRVRVTAADATPRTWTCELKVTETIFTA